MINVKIWKFLEVDEHIHENFDRKRMKARREGKEKKCERVFFWRSVLNEQSTTYQEMVNDWEIEGHKIPTMGGLKGCEIARL